MAITVDLRNLSDEPLSLRGEESVDIFELTEEQITPQLPLRYVLEIQRNDKNTLLVRGELHMAFDLVCVRCLEPFRLPIDIASFSSLIEIEDFPIVDLTSDIREAILLALPDYPHCEVLEGHTCPQAHTFEASSEKEEPSSENRKEVWDILNQIKPE